MPSDAPSEPRVRLLPLFAVGAALAAAVALAFAPALDGPLLHWDDRANLAENEAWRGLGAGALEWMFTTAHMGPYQPLAWLSFAVDLELWGGEDGGARGFHLTNVGLHALGALAFWRACVALLERACVSKNTSRRASAWSFELAGVFGAAFWAVHPLRAESVAWITERRDVLCALFYSLAAWAYVRSAPRGAASSNSTRAAASSVIVALVAAVSFRFAFDWSAEGRLRLGEFGGVALAAAAVSLGASFTLAMRSSGRDAREQRWFACALAAFVLALLSKGLAMVLPAVLLVADAWPLRRIDNARSALAAVAEKAPFLALAAMAAQLAMWGQRALPEAMLTFEEHTLAERVVQAAYGLWFYVSKTFAPFGLSPMVQLPDVVSATEPRFALGLAASAGMAGAAVAFWRRAPWWSAAFAAFALAIAPVLGFTQAGAQLVADRYSVLACMPFAVLAGGAALAAMNTRRAPRGVVWGACAAVVVALLFATRAQAAIWRSDEELWRHAQSVRPHDALVYGQLASVELECASGARDATERRERLERAVELYARELELDATPIANDLLNHGVALLRLDRAREAEPLLRRAIEARPGHYLAHANLGASLAAQQRFAEAVAAQRKALELEPGYARGWHQLGMTLAAMGDRDGAIAALERTVELWPSFETAQRALAELRQR